MRHFVKALGIVIGDRRLRQTIYKPLLWTAALFLLVFIAGWFLLVPFMNHWGASLGMRLGLAKALSSLIYLVLWIFMSGMLYLTIAGMLSSFLWDDLSSKVEESLPYSPKRIKLSISTLVFDSVLRMIFSLGICVLTVISGCLSFGALGVVFAAWLGLYDYTACAYLRRGICFPNQFGSVFRCDGWFGFALIAGLLSLTPFVNVLAMPVLVAGGAIMVNKTDQKQKL